MAYFADGVSKDKLMVLYFLNTLGLELTREQITTVSGEHELVPYFQLQSAVYELEEDGFIAAVPRAFGQAYALTELGRQALEMFQERLPQSQRAAMDAIADSSRAALKRQAQYQAEIKELQLGYRVTLRVLERDAELFKLELLMPDRQSAKAASAAWPDRAQAVYQFIVENLI